MYFSYLFTNIVKYNFVVNTYFYSQILEHLLQSTFQNIHQLAITCLVGEYCTEYTFKNKF